MKPIPYLSEDLIAQLDEMIPEKCPGLEDSDRTIWFYCGMRDLVVNLKTRLKKTQSLEDDVLPKEMKPNVHG